MYKFALVIFAVVGMCSHAHAAVLCVPQLGEGPVRIRTACKATEVRLDPAVLGLVGPAGPQGPKGDTGDTGLAGTGGPTAVVKDTAGTVVGIEEANSVLIALDNSALTLQLTGSPADFGIGVFFFYEMEKCSGARLQSIESSGLVKTGLVFDATAYYAESSGAPTTVYYYENVSLTMPGPASCPRGVFIPPQSCCVLLSSSPFRGPRAQPFITCTF